MDDERYRFFTVIGMEIKNTEDSNEFKRLSEYITLLIKSQVQDDSIRYKFPIYFRMDTQIAENQEQIEKLNNIFCNILYEYMLEGETVIDKHIDFTLSDEQLTALKRHLKEYKHRIFNLSVTRNPTCFSGWVVHCRTDLLPCKKDNKKI